MEKFKLPDALRDRSIYNNVIPTVCNLKNMLFKLVEVNGDFSQLRQWEKRSFTAYKIDNIKFDIINSQPSQWKCIVREHILRVPHTELGASCVDIYLVAYVAEEYGIGKEAFFDYVKEKSISDKDNTAQAIWQVGKGDGVYLDILNNDGSVKDWSFIKRWLYR